MGFEHSVAALLFQQRVQGPVFLRNELLDLLFPLGNQTHGHRLHAARGQAPADLLPQQGRQAVSHDAIQHTPGLLSIHQILVNAPGSGNTLLHHLLGDLIEGDSPGLGVLQIQQIF